MFNVTRPNNAICQPHNKLLIDKISNLTPIGIRGKKVMIGISETFDWAISGTLVLETTSASFHVSGIPQLQLFNTPPIQHYFALDWINFANKKFSGSWVGQIEHFVARCNITIGCDAEILAASGAEALVVMFKATHPRVTNIDIEFQPQKKTLQKLLGKLLCVRSRNGSGGTPSR